MTSSSQTHGLQSDHLGGVEEFLYVIVKKKGKKENIICFQKTKDKAKKMLQKIVDGESSLLSSDGSEIFSSGKADQNQVSLYKTEPGFIGQSLTLKSTFSIYKISDSDAVLP